LLIGKEKKIQTAQGGKQRQGERRPGGAQVKEKKRGKFFEKQPNPKEKVIQALRLRARTGEGVGLWGGFGFTHVNWSRQAKKSTERWEVRTNQKS